MNTPSPYTTNVPFLKIEDLLPAETYKQLSHDARNLFIKLDNLIKRKGGKFCRLSDDFAGNAIRVAHSRIDAIRKELLNLELITFQYGNRAGVTPMQTCHLYSIVNVVEAGAEAP